MPILSRFVFNSNVDRTNLTDTGGNRTTNITCWKTGRVHASWIRHWTLRRSVSRLLNLQPLNASFCDERGMPLKISTSQYNKSVYIVRHQWGVEICHNVLNWTTFWREQMIPTASVLRGFSYNGVIEQIASSCSPGARPVVWQRVLWCGRSLFFSKSAPSCPSRVLTYIFRVRFQ